MLPAMSIRSATSGASRLERVVDRVGKTHGTALLIGRRKFLVVERLPAAALALLVVDSQIRKDHGGAAHGQPQGLGRSHHHYRARRIVRSPGQRLDTRRDRAWI